MTGRPSKKRPARGKRVATDDGTRVLNKNANGEGSVYRQADGRWRATWWVPGDKRPRSATGATREEAIARRDKRRAADRAGLGELSTVGALATWWLHNVHRQAVRPSSWAKAEDRVRRIVATLGDVPVVDLDYRLVTEWQAGLAAELAPRTVRHHRQTLAQVIDEAVKLRALAGNPVRSVKPVRVAPSLAQALEGDELARLLAAALGHRLGAAVALLFLQGWRVSEVLGLAWEDIEFEFGPDPDAPGRRIVVGGTATVRRASVYVDGRGQQLGPPKTDGAHGVHHLMPTVAVALAARRDQQAAEREAAPEWEEHTYDGERIHLVFTTPTGGLVLRQAVTKVVKQAAKTAGIDVDVATHTGRRTVVTMLYTEGGESLDDIAHYVGHAKPSTTADYVKRLGRRPATVAKRAASLLDTGGAPTGGVRNDRAGGGSNPGSNDTGRSDTTPDRSGR